MLDWLSSIRIKERKDTVFNVSNYDLRLADIIVNLADWVNDKSAYDFNVLVRQVESDIRGILWSLGEIRVEADLSDFFRKYIALCLYTGRSEGVLIRSNAIHYVLGTNFLNEEEKKKIIQKEKYRLGYRILDGVFLYLERAGGEILKHFYPYTTGNITKSATFLNMASHILMKKLSDILEEINKNAVEDTKKEQKERKEDSKIREKQTAQSGINMDIEGDEEPSEELKKLLDRVIEDIENKAEKYSQFADRINSRYEERIQDKKEKQDTGNSYEIDNAANDSIKQGINDVIREVAKIDVATTKIIDNLAEYKVIDSSDSKEVEFARNIFIDYLTKNRDIATFRLLERLSAYVSMMAGKSDDRVYLSESDIKTQEGRDLSRIDYTGLGVNVSVFGNGYIDTAYSTDTLPLRGIERKNAKSNSGIVICIDLSSSMENKARGKNLSRLDYAKIVGLLAGFKAIKDRRDLIIVGFGYGSKNYFIDKEKDKYSKLKELTSLFFDIRTVMEVPAGGTIYSEAIKGIHASIKGEKYNMGRLEGKVAKEQKKVDILFLSDGEPSDRKTGSDDAFIDDIKAKAGKVVFLGIGDIKREEQLKNWKDVFDEIYTNIEEEEAVIKTVNFLQGIDTEDTGKIVKNKVKL